MAYNARMDTLHTVHGPIRAVIFDWGGVLEPLPDATHFARWESQLGLPVGSLIDILWGPVWEQVEVGAISGQQYEAHVCTHCGFRDRDELQAFYTAFYPQRVQPQMLAAVAATMGDQVRKPPADWHRGEAGRGRGAATASLAGL
jgi:hypothetical protein